MKGKHYFATAFGFGVSQVLYYLLPKESLGDVAVAAAAAVTAAFCTAWILAWAVAGEQTLDETLGPRGRR